MRSEDLLAGRRRRSGTVPGLHIRLFHALALRHNGNALRFHVPPRAGPLLAYILLHRHASLRRKTLASALWPDSSPGQAGANLRRHLHYLRRALPAAPVPWLLIDARTVQWNLGSNAIIDVVEFERYCAAGALLRQRAIELYKGDLLADYNDQWIIHERQRLRLLHLSNLTAVVALRLKRGDWSAVKAGASLLLELDPCREDASRAIMRAALRGGDRAGALNEFDRLARALGQNFGAQPAPETIELRDRALCDDLGHQKDGTA